MTALGCARPGRIGAAVCVVPCGATVTLARKSTGTPRIGRQHPRGYRTLGVGQLRRAHRHATACPGYQRRCAGVRRQPDEQGRVHRQRSARWLRGLLDAATLVSQGLGREDLGTADPASATASSAAADPRHWPARQFVAKESDQQQLAASTAPAPTPLHGHEGRRGRTRRAWEPHTHPARFNRRFGRFGGVPALMAFEPSWTQEDLSTGSGSRPARSRAPRCWFDGCHK